MICVIRYMLMQDLTSISDGRQQLRDQILMKHASSHGFTRIAMGFSSTRLAIQVISQAAKGCGWDIPASVQHSQPK